MSNVEIYAVAPVAPVIPLRHRIASQSEAIERAQFILTERGGALDIVDGSRWVARVFDDGGIDFLDRSASERIR